MIISTKYELDIQEGSDSIISFTFNTIFEVKNFLKHTSYSAMTDQFDIKMKLYKVTYEWDMSDGYVYKHTEEVNLDA